MEAGELFPAEGLDIAGRLILAEIGGLETLQAELAIVVGELADGDGSGLAGSLASLAMIAGEVLKLCDDPIAVLATYQAGIAALNEAFS